MGRLFCDGLQQATGRAEDNVSSFTNPKVKLQSTHLRRPLRVGWGQWVWEWEWEGGGHDNDNGGGADGGVDDVVVGGASGSARFGAPPHRASCCFGVEDMRYTHEQ